MKRQLLLIVIGLLISLVVIYGGYRFSRWWRFQKRHWIILGVVLVMSLPTAYAGYRFIRWWRSTGVNFTIPNSVASQSNTYIAQWLADPSRRPALKTDQSDLCEEAPFILPSVGFIGLLWRDSASPYSMV